MVHAHYESSWKNKRKSSELQAPKSKPTQLRVFSFITSKF